MTIVTAIEGPRSASVPTAVRALLAERLAKRRPALQETILARARAIADPAEVADPGYRSGMIAAVEAALDYSVACLSEHRLQAPPVPLALVGQAQAAARNSVSLDTVLRRYFAGYSAINEAVLAEVQALGMQTDGLATLVCEQSSLLDQLVALISDTYRTEVEAIRGSRGQRKTALVEMLLRGEAVDPSELAYDLDGFHLAAVVRGKGGAALIREIASEMDRRLLLIDRGQGVVWAWLGGRKPPALETLDRRLAAMSPSGAQLAFGEPDSSISGWRLSHRQARAAFSVAARDGCTYVRYGNVALVASMLTDDLLITSLTRLFLEPMVESGDSDVLLSTLRTYFENSRNVSSTAAALGVHRHTVTSRLRAVEDRLERPLDSCAPELEAALRLNWAKEPLCQSGERI